MRDGGSYQDSDFLRLLKFSPFERRPRGGWRFGTKVITDLTVDRLIASRRARIEGDRVVFVEVAR